MLDRYDPSANMARFYVLAVELSLFGDIALVQEWGWIRTIGHQKTELHEDEWQAVKRLGAWLSRKQRCGCRIRRCK